MSKFLQRPFRLHVLDSPDPHAFRPAFRGGRRQAVGVLGVEGEGVNDKGYQRDI